MMILLKSKGLFLEITLHARVCLSFPLVPVGSSTQLTFLFGFFASVRYDSNASASDSSDDGDASDNDGSKKPKVKKPKVVKEKKERKRRKEVREPSGQRKREKYRFKQRFFFFPALELQTDAEFELLKDLKSLPFFNLSRRSREKDPRGRWAPTCCGWMPAASASSLRTPASPSQRFPRRPERCGDNWAKTTRRWGRRMRRRDHLDYVSSIALTTLLWVVCHQDYKLYIYSEKVIPICQNGAYACFRIKGIM